MAPDIKKINTVTMKMGEMNQTEKYLEGKQSELNDELDDSFN